MGAIKTAFDTTFRDFQTDGLQASGRYEPPKSDIRALGQLIERAIGDVTLANAVGVIHALRSEMEADLAHAAGTVGLVYADPTGANNDLYTKSGSSGSGAWTRTTILHDAAASAAALAQEWAEGTEPGGSGTKSAREYAEDAADGIGVLSDLLDTLSGALLSASFIGPETPVAATGNAAGGNINYVNGLAQPEAGLWTGIRAWSAAVRTIKVGRWAKTGDDFAPIGTQIEIDLVAGMNVIEFAAPIAFAAGEHLGHATPVGGAVTYAGSGFDSTVGGWYSGGTFASGTFTDTAVSGSPLQLRFDLLYPSVTTEQVSAIEATADAARAGLAMKADYVPPLAPAAYTNAVRGRYSPSAMSRLPITFSQGSAAAVFDQAMFDAFAEPNVTRISGTWSGTVPDYKPEVEIVIPVAELVARGFVPDDTTPPLICLRAAIRRDTALNQTIDAVSGSANGQVWFGLRYDGENGSTAAGFSSAYQDCVFTNGTTGLSSSYYVPSGNPFAAVTGRMIGDTARLKGYAREGVPLRATVNGKALTHIKIRVFGRIPATGAYQLDLARIAITHGATIDDDDSYIDPADRTAASNSQANWLTIQNAAKIAVDGNSFSSSVYAPRGASWLAKVSAFSAYNFENFAVAGETLVSTLARIRSGTMTYGNASWPDYGLTYGVIMHRENDLTYERESDYADDLRATAETIRATGAIPVFCTEFKPGAVRFELGLRAMADAQGGHFVDLLPNARRFDPTPGGRDLELWGSGHPGVRTNELLSEPMKRFVASLPRPRQSLKIFRKRADVTVSAIDDLLHDDLYDRARLFAEIDIGQVALTSATAKYMDELATHAGDIVTETVNSEYLKLAAGGLVPFADYALVDAILDGTQQSIDEVALVISEVGAAVYVRNVLAAPYESATRYQRFTVTGSPTVVVGDTYTSNDPDLAGTFTVVGIAGSELIMSPMDAERTKEGAGTLTRTSGTGSASISYSAAMPGYHPDYYTALGKPEGHWVAVAGDGTGVFALSDLRGKLQVDRIQFLIHKAGGFNLSDCRIRWSGRGGKPAFPVVPLRRRPRGAEMLTQVLCGTAPQLAAWTVEGSLTAGTHAWDASPTPSGTTGYVSVSDVNRLRQTFSFSADSSEDREIEIRVDARWFPAKVNSGTYPGSAAVKEGGFHCRRLVVELLDGGTVVATLRQEVGLWWKEAVFASILPTGITALDVRIGSAAGDIDVARVSIKTVD